MNLALKYSFPFLLFSFFWINCPAQQTAPSATITSASESKNNASEKNEASFVVIPHSLPEIPREFRGVWIATVANIDWPLSPTDPWEKQKKDYLALLDYYQGLHFNAVIVQIRTAGDAFYPTNLAPWSKYLTGTQGTSPPTKEDPLEWMIDAAHKRGLEFHAWLNPYRATMDLNTAALSPQHDFNTHRKWMLKYGSKWYYDPGLPEVKAHLLKIIDEVVENYEIDAIHFDDYFYPYREPNLEFPDQASYLVYKKPGQSKDDWRRQNVNELILALSQTIKSKKPWVQFGISPFGVWRNKSKDPKGSPTQAGQTNYDDLFADVLLWMKNRWIDYLIPQLYWSMEHRLASHRILADWWSNNSYGIPIYLGNGPYKIRDDSDVAWKNPEELINQVHYGRTLPQVQGNSFFSAKSIFQKNKDVAQLLKKEVYDQPVLPPGFEPEKPVQVMQPLILNVQNSSSKIQFQLEKQLDPSIRYALVQGGNDLNSIHLTPLHKVWVGMTQKSSLEFPQLNSN
uniref:glycoside hydrolase family 10 protein n=1 Tax=Algoriphagus sp. TaxID=1872435 RepID=UPI004048BAC0